MSARSPEADAGGVADLSIGAIESLVRKVAKAGTNARPDDCEALCNLIVDFSEKYGFVSMATKSILWKEIAAGSAAVLEVAIIGRAFSPEELSDKSFACGIGNADVPTVLDYLSTCYNSAIKVPRLVASLLHKFCERKPVSQSDFSGYTEFFQSRAMWLEYDAGYAERDGEGTPTVSLSESYSDNTMTMMCCVARSFWSGITHGETLGILSCVRDYGLQPASVARGGNVKAQMFCAVVKALDKVYITAALNSIDVGSDGGVSTRGWAMSEGAVKNAMFVIAMITPIVSAVAASIGATPSAGKIPEPTFTQVRNLSLRIMEFVKIARSNKACGDVKIEIDSDAVFGLVLSAIGGRRATVGEIEFVKTNSVSKPVPDCPGDSMIGGAVSLYNANSRVRHSGKCLCDCPSETPRVYGAVNEALQSESEHYQSLVSFANSEANGSCYEFVRFVSFVASSVSKAIECSKDGSDLEGAGYFDACSMLANLASNKDFNLTFQNKGLRIPMRAMIQSMTLKCVECEKAAITGDSEYNSIKMASVAAAGGIYTVIRALLAHKRELFTAMFNRGANCRPMLITIRESITDPELEGEMKPIASAAIEASRSSRCRMGDFPTEYLNVDHLPLHDPVESPCLANLVRSRTIMSEETLDYIILSCADTPSCLALSYMKQLDAYNKDPKVMERVKLVIDAICEWDKSYKWNKGRLVLRRSEESR